MIAALTPYPEMRDSGEEWLGRVPGHWEVRRLKTLSQIRYGLGQPPKEAADGLPLIRATNVSRGEIVESDMVYVDPSDVPAGRNALLSEGEIIVVRSGAYTADSAMIPMAYSGAVTGYDMVVTVTRALPEFIALALRADYVRDDQLVVASTRSAQPHLNAQELGDAFVLLPLLHEQTAIARFLDDADRRIRRYIRAKERLIDLLEEQKQAVVHQAVTGQINVRTGRPYPAYKDSGVEWLGEIPEHWGVVGLCYRYEQCLGKMLDGKRITGEYLLPYLRNVDVQWDDINVANLPHMDIHPDEMARYTVRPGDLLVCEGGEVGRCAIWKGEISPCGFQKALHRLRPRNYQRDRPRFLYYAFLLAVARSAFTDGHESTIAHLTGEKLRRHRFAFPCVDEQTAIVRFLDNATAAISRTIELTRRQITLLREYRTRLTADVATGKLDVREAAANLPETDPIAGRNRVETIQTEPRPNATEHDLAKGAIP
ncbi:MAG: restriction endonuclease subunit S [Bryobacterales bacterium]|nr:restriction endonuclease subunit S [Bryobacterales bacterium]